MTYSLPDQLLPPVDQRRHRGQYQSLHSTATDSNGRGAARQRRLFRYVKGWQKEWNRSRI